MPRLAYIEKKLRADTLVMIEQTNRICEEYAAQGFVLTLRQVYYQFVARGLLANRQAEYKRLGDILNDARLVGLLDWNYLEDRTRFVHDLAHWTDPSKIMEAAAYSYREYKWDHQAYRPEVWIEKDALVGVIEGVCENNDVPYFSCRGYASQSEMWAAGQRLLEYVRRGQTPIILHLGDHDPSGIDMTRDILDRLNLFMAPERIEIKRLALNRPQVNQYNPPPNPAKTTDSRYAGYIAVHGEESWELDALEPTVLAALIQDAIDDLKDFDKWEESKTEEEEHRKLLELGARRWSDVVAFLQ